MSHSHALSQAQAQSLSMESTHPYHVTLASMTSATLPTMETSIHAQTMSQAHTVTPRPLWLETQGHGLTHRASFHSLLSMGSREDRLRARQDRGSIISLASTVGDDSPSDFTHFDFEHPVGDLHSQQSSTGGGLGYENDEYDHQGIGTGLAMMSFLDFMPQSRSSPGDNSVDGDVRSAQPSRSNSVILDADTANMIRMNSMFSMGEEPLHLQPEQYNNTSNNNSNHGSAQMHPLSKEPSSELSLEQSGQIPGQHPNETEGMLPSIWSNNSVDMMSASVHPFSMPAYDNKAHPLSNSSDPTLLESNGGNEQGSLEHARPGFQSSMPPAFTNSSGYFVNSDAPIPPLTTHISMANLVQQQQAHQHQQQQLRLQQQAHQQQIQHAQHQQALQQQHMHQQRLHLRSQTLAASHSPHVRNLSSPGVEYAKSPHSLTPPLHPQQQQLNQKIYGTPTGAPNFAAGKAAARVRNRTISSPAGSFQYSPSSMGSTPTSMQMSRPPSGLSFGPIPVRERKRSLMDANVAQGLDQIRQSLPGVNQQSSAQPSSDNSHLTTSSGASSGISSGDDKGPNHSPFHIKQEPNMDQNLIGLGLGAANNNNDNSAAAPEENYHRKRTKSVDMYSSYMGSLNSFNPPTTTAEMGASGLSGTPTQGTSVQNWQPPDMALHLQVYHNSINNMNNGLGSAMPPTSVPLHMQMNGQGVHPHHVSAAGGPMGGESNLYQLSNMPLPEPVHTLRHSISHDRMDPSYGLPPQQLNGGISGAKAKAKPKATKAASKIAKAKGRSMSMGDALDPEAVAGLVNGFAGNNAGASGAGAGASAGGQVGLGKASLPLGGGGGGRGGFPSVGLYQGIGRVQAFSAMAFSTFAVIHLVPPMLASVGGVEVANKALLWGRVYYQTYGLEQVLVSGSLLVHLGAGLCKAVIRMVWKVKSYYSGSSTSTTPRAIEKGDAPTVNKESFTTTNASGSTTTITTKTTTIIKTTGGSGSGSASAPGLFPYHRLAGWILTPLVIAHMNSMRLAPLEVLGDSSMVDYSFVTYLHRIGRSGPYILLVGLLAYHMFGGGPVAFNMVLPKGSARRVKVQDLVRSKKMRGVVAAVVVGVVVVGTGRIMFAEGPIPLSRVYLSLLDL
ncbi:hypothetical protein BGZ90_009569 [Linnemannia elongata]|nr:hypothetical protein BGZ90_009569 [Linnemannia elongata]